MADMPVAGACRVDLDQISESGLLDPVDEYDLADGGAADIAQAYDGNPIGHAARIRGSIFTPQPVGEDPSRIHGSVDKSGANSPGYPQVYTQIHG
jgi:hypothetical protein